MEDGKPSPGSAFRRGCFWLFGIIIPFITIGFEAVTHMQASFYRDPMPTWLHFFVLLAVPGSYLTVDLLRRRPIGSRGMGLMMLASGFALAVSAAYLVDFREFIPFAFYAIAILGLGILGLTPLWCVVAGICQLRSLVLCQIDRGMWRLRAALWILGGAALAGAMLGLPEVHTYLVNHGISQALSDNPDDQAAGLSLLRTIGANEDVLSRCYDVGPQRGRVRSAGLDQMALPNYRAVYYRLTGQSFSSQPRPSHQVGFQPRERSNEEWEDRQVADSEIGRAAVGARVRGLSLASSTIDGTIEASADGTAGPAIAYLEWTMEFRNQSRNQVEARAQITLPSGAVASRLTLWIDGQEQPAAYGKREQVTAAYQQVAVRQRRDPALLNAVGPDRVLLQCFPIPAGGTLKTKVGVTVPLVFRGGQAHLQLPHVSERNFTISPDLRHNIWIDSKARVESRCAALAVTQTPKAIEVRGAMSDQQLQSPSEAVISLAARIDAPLHYVANLGGRQASMELAPGAPKSPPSAVCLVVDGSAAMGGTVAELDWAAIARALPTNVKVNAIFASDKPVQWKKEWTGSADAAENLKKWLSNQAFVGGCTPSKSLEMAWDLCEQGPGATILWVHGPLPEELSSIEGLKQRFRRRPGGTAGNPMLVGVQCMPGPNRVVENLGDIEGFGRLPVLVSLQKTLQQAVAGEASGNTTRAFTLADPATSSQPSQGNVEASGHIVRLAALEQVMAACRSQKVDQNVTDLAVKMQLVTPLSGAVVLETKAQYDQNGLVASGPQMQPDVPEPATLVLLALGGLTLLRRRR